MTEEQQYRAIADIVRAVQNGEQSIDNATNEILSINHLLSKQPSEVSDDVNIVLDNKHEIDYKIGHANSLTPPDAEKEAVKVKGSKAERLKNMKVLTIRQNESFILRCEYMGDFAQAEVSIGEVEIPMEKNSQIKITRLYCSRF